MSTPRPLAGAIAALAAISLVATACGSDDTSEDTSNDANAGTTVDAGSAASGSDAGPDVDSVTIYSGRNEDLIQPILDQFTEATGIDVNVKYGDSADLALLIDEESAADNVQADVFLSQSPGSLGFLEQNERLATLPDETLALVDESVRDDEGKWIGFSGRQRVLVYNTELVDESELPTSVFDLTDPEWSGRIGVAPSNGSFQDFVTAMRATEGDEVTMEWLEGLAANDPVSYPKNSAIVAAVGRGEVDVGLVNHYYNYRALEEDPTQPSANHHFPNDDPGAVLIVTGAAILDGTDRPSVAAQLIEFLLSPEGQQYFAAETFEYPLAIGEPPPANLPPLDFAAVGVVAFEDLAGGLEQTRQMIADAGLQG
ncbi:MAG: iron ABC transporter substrate-binding protein [Acidimicrobiia bacterium]|nr:iron ABC transporter substrate-binding protein [Acidimicrobiia bacterium]